MESPLENDHFEPETRARSNTWPLRQPEESSTATNVVDLPAISPVSPQQTKKSSHRRNAWGNLSYADLITQAITSAPDARRTLADIYEWMVTNVPYFKDKGDSNSSAGWKNSVRHNLSLHNRFMRVQNETPGKSSWWMINPDPKPGKTARRRAASMETNKFEKRRDRIKKKIEALREGLPESTISPLEVDSSPRLERSGSFEMNSELEALGFSNSSPYGRQFLPTHKEVGMEVEWTKSSSPFAGQTLSSSEEYLSDKLKKEIKVESDASYMDCLPEDSLRQNQKQTPLPPFSTAYEINLSLLHRNSMHSYPQYPVYSLEDYNKSLSTQCKMERMSPPRSPMFPQPSSSPSSNILDSNPLLRERLLDTPSLSPPFTPMGQFMEVLNQNVYNDNFNQNPRLPQDGYESSISGGIKQELEMNESLQVQPPKLNELSAASTTPLESLFVNQYRNFVLT